MCKMIYPGISFGRRGEGVKEQKIAQNKKQQFHPLARHISVTA